MPSKLIRRHLQAEVSHLRLLSASTAEAITPTKNPRAKDLSGSDLRHRGPALAY